MIDLLKQAHRAVTDSMRDLLANGMAEGYAETLARFAPACAEILPGEDDEDPNP